MAYRLMAFVPDRSTVDFKDIILQINKIFAPDKEVKISYFSKKNQKITGFEWPDGFRLLMAGELKPDKKRIRDIVKNYAPMHPQKDLILNSQATIAIEGDRDPGMDHFNDYVYLMEIVEKIPDTILWDPESHNFLNSETMKQEKFY